MALTNGKIYNYVLDLIRKEINGGTIDPDRFNRILQACSWEKANADFKKFEETKILSDSLSPLEKPASLINPGTSLPVDYWHSISVFTISGGKTIPVKELTIKQYYEHTGSDLLYPKDWSPICTFLDGKIDYEPSNINVTLLYLEKPVEPYFDYYFDANDNIQYLEEGQNYTLKAGEEYRDGTTSGSVSSISLEMSFPEQDRVDVAYMILQKLGVIIDEQDALQYGITGSQKEEAQ